MLDRIMEHNKRYVAERRAKGKDKPISAHAHADVMVFTCMDTRLVELLEPAMGFRRGDIKILKNAGNTIRNDCDDVIRSIFIGTVVMGLKEVYIVGHKDCGMAKQTPEEIREKMLARGISEEAVNAINIAEWAGLLTNEEENVRNVVARIKSSPYIPKDVIVHGLMMDPNSGELEILIDGAGSIVAT
ncbi:MAG: beta-class carbonic anhydrase [Bacillota bacterium]